MSSNRLVGYQFAPGIDASATRIEQALMELLQKCDDVPADLVRRRWSPSIGLWGFSPPQVSLLGVPFLKYQNWDSPGINPVDRSQITNRQRAKSIQVDGIDNANALINVGNLYTWEVNMLATHPMIVGSFVVMAGVLGTDLGGGKYNNTWVYGAAPPPPHAAGAPTEDFTLQVCLSDGWDLENRRKLRQESLTYKMRSDAFKFAPNGVPLPAANPDATQPPMPLDAGVGPTGPICWNGFAVMADALVLVPAGARIVFQWTIPEYHNINQASWGDAEPWMHNTWNLRALTYSPTRSR